MTHLIELASGWSLWRWTCLRSTGFPARLVLELAHGDLGDAADRVLDREAESARARERLIAECKAAAERVAPDARRSIQRALKQLWQHRVPETIDDDAAQAARARLETAVSAAEAATRRLGEAYADARRATAATLRQFGADDRFRQALLWQNPNVVQRGVDWLARQPLEAVDAETRKNERMIASYAQRYAVKNDTIGFFGPVGWARMVEGRSHVDQRPGPSLLARRTVYFEYWAIDALAATLSADPAVRPHIAPRLLPRYRLDGEVLHYPIGRRAELSPELAAVASRCDGTRTAREIARELVLDPMLAIVSESAVVELLDELVESKVISWTLEVPTAGAQPEGHLAALLDRIDEVEARARATASLRALEARRAEVAASHDAASLQSALVRFDAAFTAMTGLDSRRAAGQTYAGRTPLYEDCRRDVEVELGRSWQDRLGRPLALLLQSARWFTHEIAVRYRRALGATYRQLREVAGDAVVDFASFWQRVPALFPGGAVAGSIVGEVRDELRQRWATILGLEPGSRALALRSADLAAAVKREFAAPGPGWPAARHHSPDVMIAAADAQAAARGDYRLVLGELHTGFNTISEPLFVKEHPRPDELVAARDADLDRVCIAPVWSKAVTRGDYYSLSPHDLDLEVGETRSGRPRSQVLSTSELVVEEVEGALEIRTRDRRWHFDVIAFFEHHLVAESFAAFSPIPAAARTPRIAIDDLVISRETWRLEPAQISWPALEEPSARFLAARRWARSLGLPRWVFVKTPEEVKPVYVDFDSTVYVEMLAKSLRGASAAAISEMLPTVEETWLVDAAGERYTSELRLAAVDPVAWQPERETPQVR